MRIQFTTTIQKFGAKGEKTGWTYIEIPADLAQQLKPANKKEFKVKGKLDKHSISRLSVLPMGNGLFILPLNASLRKTLGKNKGAMLQVSLQEDKSDFVFKHIIIKVRHWIISTKDIVNSERFRANYLNGSKELSSHHIV